MSKSLTNVIYTDATGTERKLPLYQHLISGQLIVENIGGEIFFTLINNDSTSYVSTSEIAAAMESSYGSYGYYSATGYRSATSSEIPDVIVAIYCYNNLLRTISTAVTTNKVSRSGVVSSSAVWTDKVVAL